MPAKAGIQYLALGPRFRGDERIQMHAYRYGFKMRSASACESFIACSGDLAPVSAAWRPSLSALVTRWFSCVESSATETLSWSRATAAGGKSATYLLIASVS